MQIQPTLSIIIPCYNVQDYVQAALQSVVDGLAPEYYSSIELVIIDDGSSDQTLVIINHFLPHLDTLGIAYQVIQQQNAGLSAARNAGMAVAKGEYWLFLDSDDVFIHQALNPLLHCIHTHQPDLIEFDAVKFDDAHWQNKGLYHQYFLDVAQLHDAAAIRLRTFEENRWYAWSRCYHHQLFQHHHFEIGKLFEDMMTIPYVYLSAQSIFRLPETLVGYRQRSGSILAAWSQRHIQDLYYGTIKALIAEQDLPQYRAELLILQRKNWRMMIAESIKLFIKTRDFKYLSAIQQYRRDMYQRFGRDDGWQLGYFSRIIIKRLFERLLNK